jgi:hypothetical protein
VHCTQNYWLKVRFLLYLRENIAALTECTKIPLYHPPPPLGWGAGYQPMQKGVKQNEEDKIGVGGHIKNKKKEEN